MCSLLSASSGGCELAASLVVREGAVGCTLRRWLESRAAGRRHLFASDSGSGSGSSVMVATAAAPDAAAADLASRMRSCSSSSAVDTSPSAPSAEPLSLRVGRRSSKDAATGRAAATRSLTSRPPSALPPADGSACRARTRAAPPGTHAVAMQLNGHKRRTCQSTNGGVAVPDYAPPTVGLRATLALHDHLGDVHQHLPPSARAPASKLRQVAAVSHWSSRSRGATCCRICGRPRPSPQGSAALG